jgi:predicted lipoprotein with Yx(FWY)xxD motif
MVNVLALGHRKFPGIGVLASVAAVSLLAVACGGSTPGYSSSSTNTPTSSSPAAAAASGSTAATNNAVSSSSPASNDDPYGYGSASSGTATTAPAASASAVKVGDTSKGKVLTDAAGMTLYVFKNDVNGSGKSACNGGCAAAWPAMVTATAPATVDGATGAFTLITRDDGTMQVAYKGQPIYHYAKDQAPGDTTGDGVGGVWSIAQP